MVRSKPTGTTLRLNISCRLSVTFHFLEGATECYVSIRTFKLKRKDYFRQIHKWPFTHLVNVAVLAWCLGNMI